MEKRKRGRPLGSGKKPIEFNPTTIDFSQITKLKNLNIDPRMLEQMHSGLTLDNLISHEGGIPCATNMVIIGDPGVGKTTVLLDLLSSTQIKEPERKCLFISGEMGKKQMFKYTKRYPQFGVVDTLFTSDYSKFNTKEVIEQVVNLGWDIILIDSAAEIIGGVRDDNHWDRKTAEAWLVDLCERNNQGKNKTNRFTTFILIEQVTKSGDQVGSNKMKHLMDAIGEMRREKESDGGGTYIMFTKNRNGEVGIRLAFQLTGTSIVYSNIEAKKAEDEIDIV